MIKSSYADASELRFTLDRGKFLSVGRALQRSFGKTLLGVVSVQVNDGTLTIDSDESFTDLIDVTGLDKDHRY